MRRNPRITYFGEGIAVRGGSFRHTRGLWKEFGGERVIDTPISELGFTGAAIGLASAGCPSVADLMVSDFLFDAMSQIIHQAAKLRYMSNGQISVPVVVRAGSGVGRSTGPHHSGTYHPIWAHQPGLNVVMPSNPADAKGLFKTALRGSDPVIFLEPKSLFPMEGTVPAEDYLIPFGKARVVRAGSDLTIVSCGLLLHRCVEAATELEREGLSCEIIDLRTIVPLDVNTVVESVAGTGRALIVDEGFAMCGIGAEISALIMEHAFDKLSAPAVRLHSDSVATPFSPTLQDATSVTVGKITAAARALATGGPVIPRGLQ
jgi:2-oxoisovalerate dehydrogenase E1 component